MYEKGRKTKPKEVNGDYFEQCVLGHNPGCLPEIHFSLEQTIFKEFSNLCCLLTKTTKSSMCSEKGSPF